METLKEAKATLAPWFRKRGFVSNSGKRLWYKDNGFYLTVAEIQPVIGRGFILNIGVIVIITAAFYNLVCYADLLEIAFARIIVVCVDYNGGVCKTRSKIKLV